MGHPLNPRRKNGHRPCRGVGSKQCPLAVGDELEVNIIDVGPGGDGWSRIQGFIVNVHSAKPRERVNVRITQVDERGKVAVGEIIPEI